MSEYRRFNDTKGVENIVSIPKINKELFKTLICGDCDERKNLSEFFQDNTKQLGIRRICKMCDYKRRHEHYVQTKKAKQKRALKTIFFLHKKTRL